MKSSSSYPYTFSTTLSRVLLFLVDIAICTLIARAFALSKAQLKIVNVCFLKKNAFHYLVNIRKTTLYIGSFFLNAVWLFVYIAIYSMKDDYDAYSQGCAFSKARLKTMSAFFLNFVKLLCILTH
jgi:hypothetical protein